MKRVTVESVQIDDNDNEIMCICEVIKIDFETKTIKIEYPDGEIQWDELETYFDQLFPNTLNRKREKLN